MSPLDVVICDPRNLNPLVLGMIYAKSLVQHKEHKEYILSISLYIIM